MREGNDIMLDFKINQVWIPVGCITDSPIDESAEMLTTRTRDNTDGWETEIPTTQSFSISFSGYLEQGSFVGFYEIQSLMRNHNLIEWRLFSDLEGTLDFGWGFISNISEVSANNEFITFSGLLQGYGLPNTYTPPPVGVPDIPTGIEALTLPGQIFSETFDGSVINTTDWTMVQTSLIDWSQNDKLILAENSASQGLVYDNYYRYNTPFDLYDMVAFSFDIQIIGAEQDAIDYSVGICKDLNVSSYITNIGFHNGVGSLVRANARMGGVNNEDSISIDILTAPGSFKGVLSNNKTTMTFYYWTGVLWQSFHTATITQFGNYYPHVAVNSKTGVAQVSLTVDNFYVTTRDYDTQYPI